MLTILFSQDNTFKKNREIDRLVIKLDHWQKHCLVLKSMPIKKTVKQINVTLTPFLDDLML